MLPLRRAETDAPKAVYWIKKLVDLHQAHPSERDDMKEREFESFGDFAATASFVRSLSVSLPLPAASSKLVRFACQDQRTWQLSLAL
jgi:hypothetical protein